MNDVFKAAGHPNTNTRASFLKRIQPLRNTNYGQILIISYLAPNISIWNSLPVSLKGTDSLNTYRHKIFLRETSTLRMTRLTST